MGNAFWREQVHEAVNDISRNTLDKKLKELVDVGVLASGRCGRRTLYWFTDEGRKVLNMVRALERVQGAQVSSPSSSPRSPPDA